jgi:hypothetical protein
MAREVLSRWGGPLVLYHGTSDAFDVFDSAKVGSRHVDIIREAELEEAVEPTAFYFTNDPDTAIWYAKSSATQAGKPEGDGVVMTVRLSMEKALSVDFQGEGREYLAEEIEKAKREGCDGLICIDYDDGGVSDHYIVFDPSNIKIVDIQSCAEFEKTAESCKDEVSDDGEDLVVESIRE